MPLSTKEHLRICCEMFQESELLLEESHDPVRRGEISNILQGVNLTLQDNEPFLPDTVLLELRQRLTKLILNPNSTGRSSELTLPDYISC